MSRLYDRVMSYGCEPLSAAQVHIASTVPPEYIKGYRETLRSTIQREKGVTPTDAQIDALTERIRRGMEEHKAAATLDPVADSAVVVSAEEPLAAQRPLGLAPPPAPPPRDIPGDGA